MVVVVETRRVALLAGIPLRVVGGCGVALVLKPVQHPLYLHEFLLHHIFLGRQIAPAQKPEPSGVALGNPAFRLHSLFASGFVVLVTQGWRRHSRQPVPQSGCLGLAGLADCQ